MFEDSLIESGGKLKTKRGWTSIVSFVIHFMIIGVMVLIPLIFTEALPKTVTLGFLVAPPPPPPPPPPAAAPVKVVKVVQTDISKDGNIETLRLNRAPPMLPPAALGAVKKWKYKPYLLNGEPVEVETQ